MMNVDEAGRRNMRDFLQMYNKFTQECFTRCIKNLNYRVLTQEESDCTDRCASKLVNINHRLIMKYMEINPLNKQLQQLEATQAQEQQQVEASTGAQGAVSQNDGATTAVPQNLAAQVKDVFGEETQIINNSETVVSSASSIGSSNSSNLNATNTGDSTSTDLSSTVTAESPKS